MYMHMTKTTHIQRQLIHIRSHETCTHKSAHKYCTCTHQYTHTSQTTGHQSSVVWCLPHLFRLRDSGNQRSCKWFFTSCCWAMAKMLQPAAPALWVVICPLASLTTNLVAAVLQNSSLIPTHWWRYTYNTNQKIKKNCFRGQWWLTIKASLCCHAVLIFSISPWIGSSPIPKF